MMEKKMLTVILLAILVFTGTAYATSWTLSSRVLSGGGSLQVRSDTPLTIASGTVMKTYTTSKIVPVTLSAFNGYQISAVTLNGVGQTLPVPNPVSMGLPAFNPIKTAQTVTVSFAKLLVSVTVSGTEGGSVSPVGTFTLQQGTVAAFTFTPNTGRSVTAINGLPPGASLTDASTGVAVTLPYPKAVKVTFAVPATPVSMTGSFVGVTANAGAPVTALLNTPVTLSGSSTVYDGTSASYAWTQTSGTPVTLYNATTARPSFTTSVAGTYRFTMAVTTGGGATASSSTSVTVTDSPASAAEGQCQNCHVLGGVGLAANVFNKWSTSRHNPGLVMCYSCHVGANTGAHPGPGLTSSTLLNACNGCHLDANNQVIGGHPFGRGANICVNCHDPHSNVGTMTDTPTASHYNNITTAGYKASYVTSRIDCVNCHANDQTNALVRTQWAQSAHASTTAQAFVSNDFKTMSGCVQCHTTTGFIAYSTGKVTTAWGNPADKTKEVVSCGVCHTDFTQGILRNVKPVKPYPGVDYLNRDIGKSNLCITCHSGTNNGSSIEAEVGSADFTDTPFIAPHYRSAGGTLHGIAGYHFPGQVYQFYTSNTHRQIGIDNKANTGSYGPCIGCHMSTDNKHSYLPVMTYNGNNIISLASTACANCHGTNLTTEDLGKAQNSYNASLAALKAMLTEKGFEYSATEPHFSQRNWGSGQAGADAMGAAYNYELLLSEPGAFVHNPAYAKKLIGDSIDVLYNGYVSGSLDSALSYLVGRNAISQETADSVTGYSNSTCTGCHAGPSGARPPITDNGHGTHLTGSYGPGPYLGSGAASCLPCHAGANHVDGSVEIATGVDSACAGCHPTGIPTWTDPTRIECTTCHARNGSTLPNGVSAPYKGLFASAGHGKYAISNSCTACHDANAPHISGSIGTYNRLTLPNGNDLCAFCHNDPAKVSSGYLNMANHESYSCDSCHDSHGTSNLSMLRTNIQGVDVVYLNRATDMVNTVTWNGLCQFCHTKTKYFRAGVPETVHDMGDCLACHDHKRGFLDKPAKQCNSCHGYPPVGRDYTVPNGFGTANSWPSAGFERYSGGGGAHLVPAHVSHTAKATDGWVNCTMCHSPNDHRADLNEDNPAPVISHVKVTVDPQYRFSAGFIVYTGAKQLDPPPANVTGSCFNLSCHMSRTPRWSTER